MEVWLAVGAKEFPNSSFQMVSLCLHPSLKSNESQEGLTGDLWWLFVQWLSYAEGIYGGFLCSGFLMQSLFG